MVFTDVVAAQTVTASAVTTAQTQLSTDQAAAIAAQTAAATAIANDQQVVTATLTADQAALAAIASAITLISPVARIVVVPNADGTFAVYVGDTSPNGFHVVTAPGGSVIVPDAPPVTDPNAPPASPPVA